MNKINVPAPLVFDISDDIVGFYTGRGLNGPSPYRNVKGNWIDVDWHLGEINYAIYRGDRALVYDTMTLPEQGEWVRDYLTKKKGIKHFTVVLSHWHLDHIAGNASYKDSNIVSLDWTREMLAKNTAALQAGTFWGPPGLDVVLPDVTFKDRLDLYLGSLKVELHHFNIHTRDANLMYIPSEKILFAGDALEDTLTYMVEPADIPAHIAELSRLSAMNIKRIYPQHGNPEVIKHGGYTKTFIDAVKEYDMNMLKNVHRADYLEMSIQESMPNALAEHVVSIWEPYLQIHTNNLKLLHDYYRNRSIPEIP